MVMLETVQRLISAILKTGIDATVVTGTKGTENDAVSWNADGDLVSTTTQNVDVINEKTAGAGTTIEGVVVKDNCVNISTGSLGGYTFNLADDTATSFTPSGAGVDTFMVLISCDNAGALCGSGVVWCKSTGAFALQIADPSTLLTFTTGALAGTTGTDGQFTISGHTDGKVYLENRCGGTRRGSVTLINSYT